MSDKEDQSDDNRSDRDEKGKQKRRDAGAQNQSEGESDYEEIDITDNPLYQVLSAFFENEEGENLCDHLAKLRVSLEENTKMLSKVLRKLTSDKTHE